MNSFMIISSLILFGLTILCFVLPYKSGQKMTAWIISLIFALLITLTLVGDLDFLVIFIWPLILGTQIIFIVYWAFRLFGRKKVGTIVTLVIAGLFLLIAMQPWISDLMFNKKDAKEILSYHGFELKNDFKILKNESGGFRDYYHSFTLEISDSDYRDIAKKIRSADNYQGLITDLTKQLPRADYKSYDTVNYETNYHIEREYFSQKKMDDGTFHFHFQLSKNNKELNYIGSNE
ncbi:MAG: hypothetical protein RBT05_09375 [Bacteroidales bacterium]|nr:hypothetical protein [Bacteroidales bacterium]